MSKFSKLRAIIITCTVTSFTVISLIAFPSNATAISDQSIVALTNAQRESNGFNLLSWNASLSNSAWLKANDICSKDYWAHTAPDSSTGWTFISQSGYSYILAGENLAKGFAV